MTTPGDGAERVPSASARPDWCRADSIALAAALGLGLATALALPFLTYDSWAWMVWARELSSLSMDASAGPSVKPLPVLLAAPVARFGDAGPILWLTISRASFLLCGWAAWRLGNILADRLAGAIAAVGLLLCPLLLQSAISGYAEAPEVLLLLVAIGALVGRRSQTALVALALAGLVRPEVWLYLSPIAFVLARSGSIGRARAAAISLASPAVWLVMGWLATGSPTAVVSEAISIAPPGVFEFAAKAVSLLPLPVLTIPGVALACVFAVVERNRTVGLILAAGFSWVAIFSLKVAFDFAGNPRYLLPAVAILVVCSGWGVSRTVAALPSEELRRPVRLACFAGLAIATGLLFVSNVRPGGKPRSMVELADARVKALDSLDRAIASVGGRDAVLARERPLMLNIPTRTALAWKLDVPIGRVATVWPNTLASGIKRPAFAFEASTNDAGESLGLPDGVPSVELRRVGAWRVLLVPGPDSPALHNARETATLER